MDESRRGRKVLLPYKIARRKRVNGQPPTDPTNPLIKSLSRPTYRTSQSESDYKRDCDNLHGRVHFTARRGDKRNRENEDSRQHP